VVCITYKHLHLNEGTYCHVFTLQYFHAFESLRFAFPVEFLLDGSISRLNSATKVRVSSVF